MHMTMEQHIIRIIAVKFLSALVRIFVVPFLRISAVFLFLFPTCLVGIILLSPDPVNPVFVFVQHQPEFP